MKSWNGLLTVVSMLLLIVSVLLTSFQLAIYGDKEYKFYEKEYKKYMVTDDLNMEMDDVMQVTEHMMDYLIGKESELSIVTQVDGQWQDFFNEQDRLHMADVKKLFLGGLKLRTGFFLLFLLGMFLLVFRKTDWKYLIPKGYGIALGIFVMAGFVIGIAMSVDFTACFTIFHEIFFTNDLWMFDANTDYMIRMLPEGFFSDMVVRIGIIFALGLFILGVFFLIWFRIVKKTDKCNL